MSSTSDPGAVVRRYYEEAFNKGTTEILADIASDSMRKRLEGTVREFRQGFDGLTVAPDFLLVDGNRVTARVVLRGTHTGAFAGIQPTHRYFEVPSIDIFEVNDGRIVQHWEETNMLEALRQLAPVRVGAAPLTGWRRLWHGGLVWVVVALVVGAWAGVALADQRTDSAADDSSDPTGFGGEYACEAATSRLASLENLAFSSPPEPIDNVEAYELALNAWSTQVADARTRLPAGEAQVAEICG